MRRPPPPPPPSPAELGLLKHCAKHLRRRGLARKLYEPALGYFVTARTAQVRSWTSGNRWLTYSLPGPLILDDAQAAIHRDLEMKHCRITYRRAEKAGWLKISPSLWIPPWNRVLALTEAKRHHNAMWEETARVFQKRVSFLGWLEAPAVLMEEVIEHAMWRAKHDRLNAMKCCLLALFCDGKLQAMGLDEETELAMRTWWSRFASIVRALPMDKSA